jgi:hypothetical protein
MSSVVVDVYILEIAAISSVALSVILAKPPALIADDDDNQMLLCLLLLIIRQNGRNIERTLFVL